MKFIDYFIGNIYLCGECQTLFNLKLVKITWNELCVFSLAPYEDNVRDLILRYKESYDRALYPVFFAQHSMYIKTKYSKYFVIYPPSIKEEEERRGFDHMYWMCQGIGLPIIQNVFVKKSDYRQVKLNKTERTLSANQIILVDENLIRGKKILVVDDILTTGSTLQRIHDLIGDLCDSVVYFTYAYNGRYQNKAKSRTISKRFHLPF